MQHIYSPEEYLEFEKNKSEIKNIETTQILGNKLTPKFQTLNNILNYSKSLDIKTSKWLGQIENINN